MLLWCRLLVLPQLLEIFSLPQSLDLPSRLSLPLKNTINAAINITMKLFVFGDSYAVHLPIPEWTWVENLRVAMNADGITARAVYGASLDWTYHQFEVSKDLISEGDIIIVVLTSLDRRWFFPGFPGVTTAVSLDASDAAKHLPAGAKDAALMHRRYLDNAELPALHLINWLDMLNFFVEARKARCLIISAFPDAQLVICSENNQWSNWRIDCGTPYLSKSTVSTFIGTKRWTNISFSSGHNLFFVNGSESKSYGTVPPRSDFRYNHLCRDNHAVLSSKILDWIVNGKEVVIDGFHADLINAQTLAISNWYEIELIGSGGWIRTISP